MTALNAPVIIPLARSAAAFLGRTSQNCDNSSAAHAGLPRSNKSLAEAEFESSSGLSMTSQQSAPPWMPQITPKPTAQPIEPKLRRTPKSAAGIPVRTSDTQGFTSQPTIEFRREIGGGVHTARFGLSPGTS
jgi:hypothetical protein